MLNSITNLQRGGGTTANKQCVYVMIAMISTLAKIKEGKKRFPSNATRPEKEKKNQSGLGNLSQRTGREGGP